MAISLTTLLAATQGGPLPAVLPLFPPNNWWNLDISNAPVDPASATYIQFINNGATRRLHPDFGGEASPQRGDLWISVCRGRWLAAQEGGSLRLLG